MTKSKENNTYDYRGRKFVHTGIVHKEGRHYAVFLEYSPKEKNILPIPQKHDFMKEYFIPMDRISLEGKSLIIHDKWHNPRAKEGIASEISCNDSEFPKNKAHFQKLLEKYKGAMK